MAKETAGRLFKRKWFIGLLSVIACLVLLLLAGSLVLRSQKRETCQSIGEVWQDIGHLMSQRDHDGRTDLGHNLSMVRLYVTSNLLDGILYEWRQLEEHGLLPASPSEQRLFLEIGEIEEQYDAAVQEGGAYSIPVWLNFLEERTIHDPVRTVYYHAVAVDGRAIYSVLDGTLLWKGYTSEIEWTDTVKPWDGATETERKVLTGTLFEDVEQTYPRIKWEQATGAGYGDTVLLDPGVLQEQDP